MEKSLLLSDGTLPSVGTRDTPAEHSAQLSPVPGQQSLTAARAEPAVGVLLWSAEQELFSADFAVAQSQRFQIRCAFGAR